MESKCIIALEVGSSKVCAAAAQANPGINGHIALQLITLEEQPLYDAVRAGIIQNVDTVTDGVRAVVDRLAAHPLLKGRKIQSVYVSVGGRSLTSTPVDVDTTLSKEEKVSDTTIDLLAEQATRNFSLNQSSERQILDQLPAGFTIDGRPVHNPRGQYTNNIGACFSIISARPILQRNLHRVVVENLGMECDLMVRPLAQARLVTTDEERNLGCVLVDMGAETTTVAIYRLGALQWLCTLPLGGRHITRDITSLNISEERAEALKLSKGNALGPVEGDDADTIALNEYVAARAGEIVANIVAQLSYSGFQGTDLPAGIILIGGASRLKGIDRLLAKNAKMAVRYGEPLEPIVIRTSNVEPEKYIDILSILMQAASLPGAKSCLAPIEQPQPKAETQTTPAQPSRPTVHPEPVLIDRNDPYRTDAGDELLLLDDEEVDAQQRRDDDRRSRNEARRRRDEEKRQQQEEKRLQQEENRRRQEEERRTRTSKWSERLNRVVKFMSKDESDDE